MLPLLEGAFGPIKPGIAPDQKKDIEEPQAGERRIIVRKEARLASVVKAFHVPNVKDPDSYALEVAAALLSAGESSRLQRSLVREKHLALSVSADNDIVSKDPSLFSVSADVLPGVDIDMVEKALTSEIELLQKGIVDERELQKAKNQLEAGFTFEQDSLFAQGMLLASYEIVSSWRDLDRYVPNIRAVTAKDVQRVARKIPRARQLRKRPPNPHTVGRAEAGAAGAPDEGADRAIGVIMSVSAKKSVLLVLAVVFFVCAAMGTAVALPPVQRSVLDNGLVLLSRKNTPFRSLR